MEALNDEIKSQVYEKIKNWKVKVKSLRANNIASFKTICNKLSSLSNIIHSIFN